MGDKHLVAASMECFSVSAKNHGSKYLRVFAVANGRVFVKTQPFPHVNETYAAEEHNMNKTSSLGPQALCRVKCLEQTHVQ
ncbi:hypothetical protein SCP_0105820 [Sparassis crispa]|uniref:Uncharacterized protein n=1 Tax=Sparassis crispa TaxID=139825 RepID=A0A401G6A7_9APHY|nr:hypothetical protein SCP_0105820 [Sparassis crispa]GBE77700.1 hypothetical protein SCP_0105820 [Sparassis crispa]